MQLLLLPQKGQLVQIYFCLNNELVARDAPIRFILREGRKILVKNKGSQKRCKDNGFFAF
jgi:hypothetical protein